MNAMQTFTNDFFLQSTMLQELHDAQNKLNNEIQSIPTTHIY
jgi:low affinity Fe/Cu permease